MVSSLEPHDLFAALHESTNGFGARIPGQILGVFGGGISEPLDQLRIIDEFRKSFQFLIKIVRGNEPGILIMVQQFCRIGSLGGVDRPTAGNVGIQLERQNRVARFFER